MSDPQTVTNEKFIECLPDPRVLKNANFNNIPEALAEFIDNSIEWCWDSAAVPSIRISWHYSPVEGKGYLLVTDNGAGMTAEQLQECATLAVVRERKKDNATKSISLSKYGVGLKKAAFYLGDCLRVVSRKKGGDVIRQVVLDNQAMELRKDSGGSAFAFPFRDRPAGVAFRSIVGEDKLHAFSRTLLQSIEDFESENDQFTYLVMRLNDDITEQMRSDGFIIKQASVLSKLYHFYLFPNDLKYVAGELKNVETSGTKSAGGAEGSGGGRKSTSAAAMTGEEYALIRSRSGAPAVEIYLALHLGSSVEIILNDFDHRNAEPFNNLISRYINTAAEICQFEINFSAPQPSGGGSIDHRAFGIACYFPQDESGNSTRPDLSHLLMAGQDESAMAVAKSSLVSVFWEYRLVNGTAFESLPFFPKDRIKRAHLEQTVKVLLFLDHKFGHISDNKLRILDIAQNTTLVEHFEATGSSLTYKIRGARGTPQAFGKWLDGCELNYGRVVELSGRNAIRETGDLAKVALFRSIRLNKSEFDAGDKVVRVQIGKPGSRQRQQILATPVEFRVSTTPLLHHSQDTYNGSKADMMVIREPRGVFGGTLLGPISVSQIVLEQGVVTEGTREEMAALFGLHHVEYYLKRPGGPWQRIDDHVLGLRQGDKDLTFGVELVDADGNPILHQPKLQPTDPDEPFSVTARLHHEGSRNIWAARESPLVTADELGSSRRIFKCSEGTEFRDIGGYKIKVYVTVKERDLQAATFKLISRELNSVKDSTLVITVSPRVVQSIALEWKQPLDTPRRLGQPLPPLTLHFKDEDGAPFAYEGDATVKLSSPCGLLQCLDHEFRADCTGNSGSGGDPIGSFTLSQKFTLDLNGPIQDFSNTIFVEVFVDSKNVSGRQAYQVNIVPGNPHKFQLTKFTLNEKTYQGIEVNRCEFRLGDQLQDVCFRCFDRDGNVTYPLGPENWVVELAKDQLVHPPGRGVYKAEVVNRLAESESCFEQLRLEFDESAVPLKGCSLFQSVTLSLGTKRDRIHEELKFRIFRSRLPSAVQVYSTSGSMARCAIGTVLEDLHFRVLDQNGVAFDELNPAWFKPARSRGGGGGGGGASTVYTPIRVSWLDKLQPLDGTRLPALPVGEACGKKTHKFTLQLNWDEDHPFDEFAIEVVPGSPVLWDTLGLTQNQSGETIPLLTIDLPLVRKTDGQLSVAAGSWDSLRSNMRYVVLRDQYGNVVTVPDDVDAPEVTLSFTVEDEDNIDTDEEGGGDDAVGEAMESDDLRDNFIESGPGGAASSSHKRTRSHERSLSSAVKRRILPEQAANQHIIPLARASLPWDGEGSPAISCFQLPDRVGFSVETEIGRGFVVAIQSTVFKRKEWSGEIVAGAPSKLLMSSQSLRLSTPAERLQATVDRYQEIRDLVLTVQDEHGNELPAALVKKRIVLEATVNGALHGAQFPICTKISIAMPQTGCQFFEVTIRATVNGVVLPPAFLQCIVNNVLLVREMRAEFVDATGTPLQPAAQNRRSELEAPLHIPLDGEMPSVRLRCLLDNGEVFDPATNLAGFSLTSEKLTFGEPAIIQRDFVVWTFQRGMETTEGTAGGGAAAGAVSGASVYLPVGLHKLTLSYTDPRPGIPAIKKQSRTSLEISVDPGSVARLVLDPKSRSKLISSVSNVASSRNSIIGSAIIVRAEDVVGNRTCLEPQSNIRCRVVKLLPAGAPATAIKTSALKLVGSTAGKAETVLKGEPIIEAGGKCTGAAFAKLELAPVSGKEQSSLEGTMELEFILELPRRDARFFILHQFHFCSSEVLTEKRNRLERCCRDITVFYRAHELARRELAALEGDVKTLAGHLRIAVDPREVEGKLGAIEQELRLLPQMQECIKGRLPQPNLSGIKTNPPPRYVVELARIRDEGNPSIRKLLSWAAKGHMRVLVADHKSTIDRVRRQNPGQSFPMWALSSMRRYQHHASQPRQPGKLSLPPLQGKGHPEYLVNLISLPEEDEHLRETLFYNIFREAVLVDTRDDAYFHRDQQLKRVHHAPDYYTREGFKLPSSGIDDNSVGSGLCPTGPLEFMFGQASSPQDAARQQRLLNERSQCGELLSKLQQTQAAVETCGAFRQLFPRVLQLREVERALTRDLPAAGHTGTAQLPRLVDVPDAFFKDIEREASTATAGSLGGTGVAASPPFVLFRGPSGGALGTPGPHVTRATATRGGAARAQPEGARRAAAARPDDEPDTEVVFAFAEWVTRVDETLAPQAGDQAGPAGGAGAAVETGQLEGQVAKRTRAEENRGGSATR